MEDKIKSINDSFLIKLEEYSTKYPNDIGLLYESYKQIKKQNYFSKQFLDGYLSTISDLILIKDKKW